MNIKKQSKEKVEAVNKSLWAKDFHLHMLSLYSDVVLLISNCAKENVTTKAEY